MSGGPVLQSVFLAVLAHSASLAIKLSMTVVDEPLIFSLSLPYWFLLSRFCVSPGIEKRGRRFYGADRRFGTRSAGSHFGVCLEITQGG